MTSFVAKNPSTKTKNKAAIISKTAPVLMFIQLSVSFAVTFN